jgi:hypothetical protein
MRLNKLVEKYSLASALRGRYLEDGKGELADEHAKLIFDLKEEILSSQDQETIQEFASLMKDPNPYVRVAAATHLINYHPFQEKAKAVLESEKLDKTNGFAGPEAMVGLLVMKNIKL